MHKLWENYSATNCVYTVAVFLDNSMLFNEGNHNTKTDITVQYKMLHKLIQVKLSKNAARNYISKPCFAVNGKLDLCPDLDTMALQSMHAR